MVVGGAAALISPAPPTPPGFVPKQYYGTAPERLRGVAEGLFPDAMFLMHYPWWTQSLPLKNNALNFLHSN